MSKAQHTPGPWSLAKFNPKKMHEALCDCNGKLITYFKIQISRGDARLIAAAPELLELAQLALAYIDAIPKDAVLPAMPGFDRDWADNVIAKAKGE